MSQTIINVGTPDTGDGDPLRNAMIACNSNFSELYNPEGGIYAPGYSPFPLCESNLASVGSSKNCYSIAVADSYYVFDRCKVFVDFVNFENDPSLQVAVYQGDTGDLVNGIESFMTGSPSFKSLTLKGLFTTTFTSSNNYRGIVELTPDTANGAPVISEIQKGTNLLIVTALNDWVALHGRNLSAPFGSPPSGLSTQGQFEKISSEDDIAVALKDAGIQEIEGMPSCQFYKFAPGQAPAGPAPEPIVG